MQNRANETFVLIVIMVMILFVSRVTVVLVMILHTAALMGFVKLTDMRVLYRKSRTRAGLDK